MDQLTELDADEVAIVELVGNWVDREVKPVVQELEHANTYPEGLIEQMKQMGIFGLAIPEPWGGSSVVSQTGGSARQPSTSTAA